MRLLATLDYSMGVAECNIVVSLGWEANSKGNKVKIYTFNYKSPVIQQTLKFTV